jgi:hypothetical protein
MDDHAPDHPPHDDPPRLLLGRLGDRLGAAEGRILTGPNLDRK